MEQNKAQIILDMFGAIYPDKDSALGQFFNQGRDELAYALFNGHAFHPNMRPVDMENDAPGIEAPAMDAPVMEAAEISSPVMDVSPIEPAVDMGFDPAEFAPALEPPTIEHEPEIGL